MAYASGGVISATDYNNLAWGGTQGTYTAVTKNIAYVMGVGSGAVGYGQTITAINTVAGAATVTATQWSGLLTLLNGALGHQSGAGAVLSGNYTAGQTITFFANVNTAVTTINTNAALYSAQGATTTGANFDTAISSTTGLSTTVDRTVTFASADAARYFFNAGGRLKLNVSGAQSASTTARTNAAIALCTNLGGIATFGANTNGGRNGAGGTLNTNDTTKGYWTSTYNANTTVISVTSTTASYTSDTATIAVNPNGSQGSYNGNGLNVDFWINLSSTAGANAGSLSFDDSLGIAVTRSIDVSYPEVTNISNTWGAVTITSL